MPGTSLITAVVAERSKGQDGSDRQIRLPTMEVMAGTVASPTVELDHHRSKYLSLITRGR